MLTDCSMKKLKSVLAWIACIKRFSFSKWLSYIKPIELFQFQFHCLKIFNTIIFHHLTRFLKYLEFILEFHSLNSLLRKTLIFSRAVSEELSWSKNDFLRIDSFYELIWNCSTFCRLKGLKKKLNFRHPICVVSKKMFEHRFVLWKPWKNFHGSNRKTLVFCEPNQSIQ